MNTNIITTYSFDTFAVLATLNDDNGVAPNAFLIDDDHNEEGRWVDYAEICGEPPF